MAILKIKDKGVWKEIQAIKGDTGHDVYIGDKSKAPSEAKLIIEPVKGTATGTDIQITDSVNDRVSKLVLDGKSTQETTTGKNLFDKDSEDVGHVYSITGSYGASVVWTTSDWIPVDSSSQYTLSWKTTGTVNIFFSEFDANKTFIQRTTTSILKPTNNTKYVRLSYKNDIGTYDIQLEEGSAATEYEPYGVMPSPDYPSEIENVKGKNLFDKNKKAGSSNAKKDILNTGVRATLTSPVNWARISIDIGKTELLGKTISYGAEMFASGQNEGRIALYFGSSATDGIQLISYLEQTGTKTTTIPSNFPSGADRIKILLYATVRNAGNIGDYVEYTNLMVVEGSMPNKYVPYGNIQIVETGKNLWQPYSNITSSGITLTQQSNGNILLNGTATGDTFFRIALNKFINEATTLSCNYKSGTIKGGSVFVRTRTSKSILNHSIDIGPTTTTGIKLEHKTAENYYQEITIQKGAILSNVLLEIMLLKGTYNETNLSDYKPYTEEVVNIDLKGNELCSLPNGTKDELIVKDGRAKIIKRIGKVVLDGSEDWGYSGGNSVFYITSITDYAISDNIPYSNYYNGITNVIGAGGMITTPNNTIAFINISGQTTPRFYIKDTRYTDNIDDFKTWLSTHNTTVQYELAEPYEIDLGEVSTLTTYEGTSNITNSEDAEMSIEYDTNKTNLYYQNNGNIIKINKGS